jgi:hypothetical protein
MRIREALDELGLPGHSRSVAGVARKSKQSDGADK